MVSKNSRCGWLGGLVLLALGLWDQRLAAEPAAAAQLAATVRQVLDLPYAANGPQQSLDLYLPPPGPGRPPSLFVYIHGGAWVSGDKGQYRPLGLALAGQGVAVAIINYRLSGSGPHSVRHPAHVQDAAAAVAWLLRHAAQYGYDPSRVFVGGHSAGAHISALLAYDCGYLLAVGQRPESIAGFVGLEGIYDLNELVRRFPSYRVDFLQTVFGTDETAWRSASPVHLIAQAGKGPLGRGLSRPWLLVHARTDELVDQEQSRHFQKALEKQGIPVRWLAPERSSHFGVLGELAMPQSLLSQQLLAFLRS